MATKGPWLVKQNTNHTEMTMVIDEQLSEVRKYNHKTYTDKARELFTWLRSAILGTHYMTDTVHYHFNQ